MSKAETLTAIQTSLDQILDAKGAERIAVEPNMAVLDGPASIDSLDLAQIVLDLQTATGRDPFAEGFIEFRTFGDLVDLFAV